MEVRDVNFSYNGTDAILKNVSFTIQKNKINTIVGPNGSGKSTLLEILARLLSPNSGDVLLGGKSIFEWKAKEFAQNVAIVHQSNVLPNELMVKELLYFGRLPYKNWRMTRTKEDDLAVERALMQTELTEKAEKFVDSLSGGERQRVFIATALVQDTPILLLDEPTRPRLISYAVFCLKKKKHRLPEGGSVLGIGAGEGNRTPDLRVTNALLYRLSYTGVFRYDIYKRLFVQLFGRAARRCAV